jgi:hypothetical protein
MPCRQVPEQWSVFASSVRMRRKLGSPHRRFPFRQVAYVRFGMYSEMFEALTLKLGLRRFFPPSTPPQIVILSFDDPYFVTYV